MSLKAIHILFITLSTLLTLGFGAWCMRTHFAEGNGLFLTFGLFSFAAAVALVAYGFWFLRKLKHGGFR